MSRPFSYNDENMSVIGNVLFCHVKLTNKFYGEETDIIEVPPAIYERLMFYGSWMFVVGGGADFTLVGDVTTHIVSDNGKYYLRTMNPFNVPPYEHLIGYYLLKDI